MHLLWVLWLLVCAACAPAPAQEPLKIGLNAWPGYDLVYLAQARGYLREEGAHVRLIDYPSLSDARAAFERGQLDGFASTLVEVLKVRHGVEREPMVTIVTDFSNGPDVLLARAGVPDIAALRGRRIGCELDSVSVYLLARALRSAGLSLNDVRVVGMDQSGIASALVRGDVDAAVTYPPVAYGLQARQDVHTLFSSRQTPGELLDVISFDRAALHTHADDIAALRRAWHRAVVFLREHPQEAIALIAQRERATVADTARAMAGLEVLDGPRQQEFLGTASTRGRLPGLLQQMERALVAAGILDEPVRVPCCVVPVAPWPAHD